MTPHNAAPKVEPMLKPDLKHDDICTCGSGRRYADCHRPIYTAPRGKAVEVAQEIYAREWGVNANHYATAGLYAALAAELMEAGEVARVLDIGCGLGQGLEALSAAIPGPDRLIAGIDENPHCFVPEVDHECRYPLGRTRRQRPVCQRSEDQLSGIRDR